MQHTEAFQQKIRLIFNIACTSRPWESISMNLLSGLPKTKFGYDYLFMIVDLFSKMVILIPCKKTITGEGSAMLFFQHGPKCFCLLTSIILYIESILKPFLRLLWE